MGRRIINHRTAFVALVGFVFAMMVILESCSDEGTDGGLSEIVFPDSSISYGRHVQPLFDRGCAFAGCHGPDTRFDHGYSLESYSSATSRAGIIVPFVPDASLLILAVEGRAPNVRVMPPAGDALNANQRAGLRRWIAEGALNN